MKVLEDFSEITIKTQGEKKDLILEVQVGVNYPNCVLIIVDDELELNTDYELYVPSDTLESESGKLYGEPINISFKTAHTVLKGWISSNFEIRDSTLKLIDMNGEEIRTMRLGDGGYIFTNIDSGEYKLKLIDKENNEYEKNINVTENELNILNLLFENIEYD